MSHNNHAEKLVRDLDWNLLRTFTILAKSNSISEAAIKLRLKQPTVSAALIRLEERLGKKLINRSPGHFELTEAGKLLEKEAIDIHGSILRLATLMRDVTDEIQGHVTITMASHVQCDLFDQALTQFHLDHPKATLSIEISASKQAIEKVVAQQASLAICLVRDRSPKLEYLRLFREFFGLFCGPPHTLFGKENLHKNDLAGHSSVSFVTDQMDDALRPVTLMRAEADLNDRIVATSAHLEEVKRMITAGLGIGPLPIHVVKQDVENGSLWRLPPYDAPPAIDVYVAWNPKSRLNRAEAALLEILCQKIHETPMSDRIYG